MNKAISNEVLNLAHDHCANNKSEIIQSKLCGCFYCQRIFKPKEIKLWLNEKEETALCPYCTIDSFLGDASGMPITKTFLQKMHKKWF